MDGSQENLALIKRSDPNFDEQCKKIANDMTTQKTTMLDVVLKLEPYFSSKEVDDREEGVHVLSSILEFIPITSLWQSEVAEFCRFYKGRLNDHYKVIPAVLNGILALSKYDQPMTSRVFTEILTAMFQTVSCQAQQYSERLKIYQILRNVLRNQTAELLDLGPDFVYGVISAIDGERDPRNLIFLFKWLPEFISTVKLGHLAEEMYEVMSCYFPVDFRVPAADANGIGRDALAEALTPCLCATNDFAEQTIQLAIEKLESDLLVAKCDSLQLLRLGCKKFTNDVYVQYKTGIWSALQNELLKSPPPELEALLLATVTEISRKLSSDRAHFVDVFDQVLETNVGNINAAEKLFAPTCKLFLAMSRGNAACAQRILHDVQPRFLNLFNITATKEHRVAILRVLIEFIKIGDSYNVNTQGIPHFLMTLLVQSDQELRALSLEALCYINTQFDEIKPMLLEQWGNMFIERSHEEVQRRFHQCILHHAAKCNHEIVMLIESLPLTNFVVLMDNLCALSSRQPFTELFFKFQEKYFEQQIKICLKTFCKALYLHTNNDELFRRCEASNLIETKVLQCTSLGNVDESDLMNAMEILMCFVGSYAAERQAAFVQRHLPNVLHQFEHDAGAIFFVSGLITNLSLPVASDFGILDKLFALACGGHEVAQRLLANLVNKLPEEAIAPFVARFEGALREKAATQEEGVTLNCGNVAVWLTKALFMRGHRDRLKWAQILIEYLRNRDVIANAMKTIMSDDCSSFSSSSHCRRRLLYKQDFFLEMCKLLDANFATNSRNCILIFSLLAQEVPLVILKMNFEKFIRMIILCLDNYDDPSGPVPILETIGNLIETGDALGEQYVDDFLPRLLKLAQCGASMRVRIAALRCVRLYGNEVVPLHKLLMHKTHVTQALGHCVDDRKRLVRKEAADARLKWFLLGAPI